ncbi:MAG: tRNA (adenosine(37)-N6)-threonylcarbamoyltransferase complex transferase subunit TsaD [Bacteroidia bacterium]
MAEKDIIILGVESSCDETSAAVTCNNKVFSNVIAGQKIHELYGGVVPELASRAHQKNIIPVIDRALKEAKVKKNELAAVAYTNGPGLIGSLMVGSSFSKSFALALNIPTIEVNHLQAHVLAHFAVKDNEEDFLPPRFPFLCLTVSGGHTQIVLVSDYFEMKIIGQTRDDAAGEAFDKIAKIIGLPYPGGPLVDKLAAEGNPLAYKFPHPKISGLDFSFSGLKTSVLYFLKKEKEKNPAFAELHKNDLCASVQHTIVSVLIEKLIKASEQTGIKEIAIAGGVSANSGLRNALSQMKVDRGWNIFIPPFEYCTDNAAMIAVTGYFKFLKNDFATQDSFPFARFAGF